MEDGQMATNLAIEEDLLAEALKVGGLKTKKATVNEALREFIQRRNQLEVLKIFGTIDFDPEYDHKKGRSRR
jgi:Arc/MetJ family transcription regulator